MVTKEGPKMAKIHHGAKPDIINHAEKEGKKKTTDRIVCQKGISTKTDLQKHCEEVHTDMDETKEEQENRAFLEKSKPAMYTEKRTDATQIKVGLDRLKLRENKVNGPEDAIVSDVSIKKIYTLTLCYQERFMGMMEFSSSWKVVKMVFLKNPDAPPTKGIRSHRAVPLTSVMSEWYASCILLRLEKEKGARKMEELACWWIGWDNLPTTCK